MTAEEVPRKETSIRLKFNGKWVRVSESQILKHPGGSVITQYDGADASQVFDAFHNGSTKAYKQLKSILDNATLGDIESEVLDASVKKRTDITDINVAAYDITVEQEKRIVKNFEKLREEVISLGMLDGAPYFYAWKCVEVAIMFSLVFWLQYKEWYVLSAVILGLNWQQLAWLAHEFAHHCPSKNRAWNDRIGLFLGNFCQGYSIDWWKDRHNTHHAACNVIEQDTDLNIMPLFALIPSDLLRFNELYEKPFANFIPYQHIYLTMFLPMLRTSWAVNSARFAFSEQNSAFRVYRRNALNEQFLILLHWSWVALQLYLLPNNWVRVYYYLISQGVCGFLIGHVVSFSHYSVDKYPENSRILNNYAALQLLTTRNMNPSYIIDWIWGGLNYQVEHHLFPSMPRVHLYKCSKMVKQFCKDNDLPYLCDSYKDGYMTLLDQLKAIAELSASGPTA